MSNNLIEKLSQHLDFPQLFQIVLNEDITQKIYEEFNMDESERTLSNINHQLVTILGIRIHEGDYYGLIQYQGRWYQIQSFNANYQDNQIQITAMELANQQVTIVE